MEDNLIVTYDCYSPDVATLCVAKRIGEKIKILNVIQGENASHIYRLLTGNTKLENQVKQKKKRKYYRKCGICGERYEQSEMVRTNQSPNGWLCFECHNSEHLEYEDLGEY